MPREKTAHMFCWLLDEESVVGTNVKHANSDCIVKLSTKIARQRELNFCGLRPSSKQINPLIGNFDVTFNLFNNAIERLATIVGAGQGNFGPANVTHVHPCFHAGPVSLQMQDFFYAPKLVVYR